MNQRLIFWVFFLCFQRTTLFCQEVKSDLKKESLRKEKESLDSTKTFQEVVITGKTELISVESNTILYNVAKSITAQGLSAFEALKKAPSVSIEQDRTILLNGKAGVTILIDGKQTYLAGAELIDFLKAMPASTLKSVEIINSPSAKYDATGAAGIINLKTLKSQNEGLNGALTSGMNYGISLKNVQEISFNYRKQKSNFFGSYNHFLGYRNYVYGSYRIQDGKWFDSQTNDTDKRMNLGLRLGYDYDINQKNRLGCFLNVSSIFGGGITQTKTNLGLNPTTTLIDQVLEAENDYYFQKTMRYTANVNYQYEDSTGRMFQFDVDYSTFDKGNANRQSNNYFKQSSFLKQNLYRSLNEIAIDLKGVKVDYTTRLFNGQLETGAKFAEVVAQNDAQFFHQLPAKDSVDDQRTSTFNYSESVAATYLNYKKKLGKWNLQAGFRVEKTFSSGILHYLENGMRKEAKTPRNYTNFFPSLSAALQVNPKTGISVAYSRRIERPAYPDLNPFVYLLDDVSYWQGNPNLLPQMTHRATLQYAYQNTTIVAVTYAHTDQYSTRVNDGIPGSSVVVFRPLNLGIQKNTAFSLTHHKMFNQWWSLQFNTTLYRIHNIVSFDQFRHFNLKQTAVRMNLQQTLKLPYQWTAELTNALNTKRLIGANERANGFSQMDIGIQRKFLNEKATFRIVVSDIYKGNQLNSVQTYDGFYLKNDGYYESRQVRISFSYKFAHGSVKNTRTRNSSLEMENNRAK
jgi:hypothetical protein